MKDENGKLVMTHRAVNKKTGEETLCSYNPDCDEYAVNFMVALVKNGWDFTELPSEKDSCLEF